MKILFFILGLVVLIVVEIARVYFIMPFPGSQIEDTIDVAYFLHNNIVWIRIVGFLFMVYPTYWFITKGKDVYKWTCLALITFWLLVAYAFNFRFLAEKMFYQPENKILVKSAANKVPNLNLVIGVSLNGEARAYPIEIIGYHHQVRDTLAGQSIMVTYCTVCRTGRVFIPEVNGKIENFRLVGMDHFNAMFEDSQTKSWWRQANGEAITGPLKGTQLPEFPSEQMTLQAWLTQYPDSYIMQPDSSFKEQYAGLAKYDEGTIEGKLEGTDSLSWKDKSWVVGVQVGSVARAYDWNDLKANRVIIDELNGIPLMVALQNDTASFHVWNRVVGLDTLQFQYTNSSKAIIDAQTQSIWDWTGRCIEGPYKGSSLKGIQSYQEFWHSWKTFHPGTTQYSSN